ncbi:MAG: ATP-binding cassette domain-containing protein [Eubacteriales bacterium]|nr:ATP-binding cassette domain-containing protein [Eubacteriales bacterium]
MKLEGRNLTFSYEEKEGEVFNNVNLSVESHEQVAILGPSGFGKTTLCKILAGYLEPDSGQVLLDGIPLPKKGYCPVQMIWQHPERAVNPRLRMRDTLSDGQDVEKRIISELGIEEDWLNRYPQELSGGELQRFCIARALGRGTKFLIADEISTMLDLITQSQIWNFLIKEVKEREIGLIVVSHSEPLLQRVAQRRIQF